MTNNSIYNAFERMWQHTVAKIDSATKIASEAETVTVTADSWTGDAAPYIANITSTLATTDNNLIIGAGGAVTTEQQAAMMAAMIICTALADGSITLSAFGTKPEIDLPVNIICVG